MPTIGHEALDPADISPTNRSQRRHPSTTPLCYSPNDAAKVIGISRARLYELLGDGSITAKKLGARTLIEHDELQRFIDSLPLRESVG